jgi:hypothetical protein
MIALHRRAPGKILEGWVKTGFLVRLKRGLYSSSENLQILAAANIMHAPSYVSMETALAFYGLIPERVEGIISVADGRHLTIENKVGRFIYHSQNRKLFARGMSASTLGGRSFLIASKEKAILDTLAWKNLPAADLPGKEIFEFVTRDLRIDGDELRLLSIAKLKNLAKHYRNFAPKKLAQYMSQLRRDIH